MNVTMGEPKELEREGGGTEGYVRVCVCGPGKMA